MEDQALGAWEAVLRLPRDPEHVSGLAERRRGAGSGRASCGSATEAYREADRRAPVEDKPEIAARLGWLAKETGDTGAARRYFARSRGDGPAIPLAYAILGITIVISFYALSSGGRDVGAALLLDKSALRHGEIYRLLSPVLIHNDIIHLAFNMYALYLLGPIVEGIWGTRAFGGFYVLTRGRGLDGQLRLHAGRQPRGVRARSSASSACSWPGSGPTTRSSTAEPGRSSRSSARSSSSTSSSGSSCPVDRQRRPHRRAGRRSVARLLRPAGPGPDAPELLAGRARQPRGAADADGHGRRRRPSSA